MLYTLARSHSTDKLRVPVNAMRQQSRGGAATIHFTCLDPEVEDLAQLKNPMTLQEKSFVALTIV